MIKPVRIQRKRTKGYNMQEHSKSINGLECIYVGRPGKWGNPFRHEISGREYAVKAFNFFCNIDNADLVCAAFDDPDFKKNVLKYGWRVKNLIHELKGKNLACFCKDGEACHADVLLRIANES